ncbi:MAG: hypothetical protein ACPGUZ_02085 [Holosporaceae bacterium]
MPFLQSLSLGLSFVQLPDPVCVLCCHLGALFFVWEVPGSPLASLVVVRFLPVACHLSWRAGRCDLINHRWRHLWQAAHLTLFDHSLDDACNMCTVQGSTWWCSNSLVLPAFG